MIAALPDKWIRKAIYDRIHNIDVDYDGNVQTIPCFDERVSKGHPKYYILLTTQTADQTHNKCGDGWESSILIDIVTKFTGAGNQGSRLLADNIAQEVLTELDDLNLDPLSGLKINNIHITFPSDITSLTKTENVFRKLIRYELGIN